MQNIANHTTKHAREQEILGWQIQDRRQAALAGLADGTERLRRLIDEMSTATRMYPKTEDASKALEYAQNQITWGFANLLTAVHDARAKAHEADALAATLAGLERADAAAAPPDLITALEDLLAHRECPANSPEAEAARRALAQARGEVRP
ncbi:MAG: hypothetical protein FJW34_21775 [Acidobacteria bacterium]|nr:hypothetical protein [Acidobacteriota bacterium]